MAATFAKIKQSMNYSEYMKQKKPINKNIPCRENFNYLEKTFDKTQLYINLYTKMDLTDVNVISNLAGESPTTINPEDTFYLNYIIDPTHTLFGSKLCEQNNYLKFLRYNRRCEEEPNVT
jgi:hypothetical protein